LAFVVPGSDRYSTSQGVSTPEAGGVDAGVLELLLATLDASAPYLPSFSAILAGTLDQLALLVDPQGSGTLTTPYSRLSFPAKVAVLQIMDGNEALAPLAGILPAFVAYLVYSDAGTFDPQVRDIRSRPLGWDLSNYERTSDGWDEFQGYFKPHGGT